MYTAGGLAVRGGNGVVIGERSFAGRQGRRLFVRLVAIHEPAAQPDLADDLWGPMWPAAWQSSLRALVSKLRALLARAGAPDAIWSRDNTYAVTLPAMAWLDLDAAADAAHRAATAMTAHDFASACGWALAARAIASRPLLPGEDGEWLDALRLRLTDIRLRAIECLAEIWIERGDLALAARDATEAIGIDPFRESAHRLLIRAHLAAGDHGAAVRAYDACRRQLAEELGVEPSPDTVALVAPALARRGSGAVHSTGPRS